MWVMRRALMEHRKIGSFFLRPGQGLCDDETACEEHARTKYTRVVPFRHAWRRRSLFDSAMARFATLLTTSRNVTRACGVAFEQAAAWYAVRRSYAACVGQGGVPDVLLVLVLVNRSANV
jgi:hypothetical protein